MEEIELLIRVDGDKAVRFGDLGRDLRQMFGAGDANRKRQPDLLAGSASHRISHLRRSAKEVDRPGNLEEGLIDRDALDDRGEVGQHGHHLVTEALVLTEIARHEAEARAQLAGPPPRHPTLNAEGLRLVGRGQHDASPDSDRLAGQGRVEQLLDRCVKRIEVGMEDGGCSLHADSLERTGVRFKS